VLEQPGRTLVKVQRELLRIVLQTVWIGIGIVDGAWCLGRAARRLERARVSTGETVVNSDVGGHRDTRERSFARW